MNNSKIRLALVALLVAVTLTYSNHFHNSFHFDDNHTITGNVFIRELKNIPRFFRDGTTSSNLPPNQSYRPVLTTTLAIDYWLAGGLENTLYYHIDSFILFLILAILMYLLLSDILQRCAPDTPYQWVALFATAWFMLHPVGAETVNYIIQRGDLLSTLFVVLAIVVYIYYPNTRKNYLYLLPAFLGILTKPSALMFAPILFMYVMLIENDKFNLTHINDIFGVLKKTILSFIVCVVGYIIVSKMQPSTYISGANSPLHYMLTQPFIMFYYVTAWFAPVHLNADTDWGAVPSFFDPYCLLGFTFVAFGIYTIIATSRYKITRPITFGLAWFFIANIPTTIVSFSEVTNDHRMFFPFVGLALAVVWTGYLIVRMIAASTKLSPSVYRAFYLLLAILLIGNAYGTHQRNKVWKDDETLWKDCAEKSPKNGRGLMNYGLTLMAKGDLVGAEKCFSDGLVYWTRYSYLYVNMGVVKEAQGKMEEAETYYKKGVEYNISQPNTYYYYARFLNNRGRMDEAIPLLRTALNMSAANLDCRYLLMDVLYKSGRYEELKQIAQGTLQLAAGDAKATQYLTMAQTGKSKIEVMKDDADKTQTPEAYLNVSLEAYYAQDYMGCVHAAEKALELRPNYAAAYNNIGSAYNVLHKYREAKEALVKAVALDPNSQLAKNNLAIAEKGLKDGN